MIGAIRLPVGEFLDVSLVIVRRRRQRLSLEIVSGRLTGSPLVVAGPGSWRQVGLDEDVRQDLIGVVVQSPELVSQPEIDHFRKVEGLEGIDVNVLALVEDQLAGHRQMRQPVR